MAGEFHHTDPGDALDRAEFQDNTIHVVNQQAAGDLLVARNSTVFERLAIGTGVLSSDGTTITWEASDSDDIDIVDLGDTPSTLTGQSGKILEVNTAEDALVFVDKPVASGDDNVQSNWTETNTNSDAYILNKPTIPTVNEEVVFDLMKNVMVAGAGMDVANSDSTNRITYTAETASATNPGVVELATTSETKTGSDATRAVTPDGHEFSHRTTSAYDTVTLASFNSTNAGSWTDTGLSFSIAPSSTSKRIMLHMSGGIAQCTKFGDNVSLRILRGSTEVGNAFYAVDDVDNSMATSTTANFMVVDHPNTTSSTTYKVQVKASNGGIWVVSFVTADPASFVGLEIG